MFDVFLYKNEQLFPACSHRHTTKKQAAHKDRLPYLYKKEEVSLSNREPKHQELQRQHRAKKI